MSYEVYFEMDIDNESIFNDVLDYLKSTSDFSLSGVRGSYPHIDGEGPWHDTMGDAPKLFEAVAKLIGNGSFSGNVECRYLGGGIGCLSNVSADYINGKLSIRSIDGYDELDFPTCLPIVACQLPMSHNDICSVIGIDKEIFHPENWEKIINYLKDEDLTFDDISYEDFCENAYIESTSYSKEAFFKFKESKTIFVYGNSWSFDPSVVKENEINIEIPCEKKDSCKTIIVEGSSDSDGSKISSIVKKVQKLLEEEKYSAALKLAIDKRNDKDIKKLINKICIAHQLSLANDVENAIIIPDIEKTIKLIKKYYKIVNDYWFRGFIHEDILIEHIMPSCYVLWNNGNRDFLYHIINICIKESSSDFLTIFEENGKTTEDSIRSLIKSLAQNDISSANIGDIIKFGKLNEEDMYWRILAIEGQELVLLSEFITEYAPYHNQKKVTTWEKCTLRDYLNNEFYEKCFNADEKNKICVAHNIDIINKKVQPEETSYTEDKVYILNYEECKLYISDKNARRSLDFINFERNGKFYISWWWLRTVTDNKKCVDVVMNNSIGRCGTSNGGIEVNKFCGIRPVIRVKL